MIGRCLALLALWTLVSPSSVMAEGKKTTLGVTTTVGATSLPFVIAESRGFFKAEGVDLAVVTMQNQVVVQGVLSREVDYGGTFSNFVGAALAGLPIRIVMALMEGSDHVLVAAPTIKRVEDLKGKTVGISSFGSTPHSEALLILRKYGLNPEREVTFLQIGGSASRYAALASGSIQAAMLEPPFNTMGRQRGFNELVSFNDVMKIPLAGLAVHTDTIRDRPGEIVAVIKAVLKAVDFIRTERSSVLAHMEQHWGIRDPDLREALYGDIVGLYSRTGIASDDKMQNARQMVQDARKLKGGAPPSAVADWSFAQRAGEALRSR